MNLVSYESQGNVAIIRMDDQKRNAVSPQMIIELSSALDRAEESGLVPVLTGREGTFSAGFDLKVMRRGGLPALSMVRDGLLLAARMLESQRPIVTARTGNAYAMGLFLVLAADYRIAATGDYALVAVGMTLPRAAVELCRAKIPSPHFQRATMLSNEYSPQAALEAGIVDELVSEDDLLPRAIAKASALDYSRHNQAEHRRNLS